LLEIFLILTNKRAAQETEPLNKEHIGEIALAIG